MLPFAAVLARAPVPTAPLHGNWDALLDEQVATAALHPLEASLARALPPARRATFVAGRAAMRLALRRAQDVADEEQAPAPSRPAASEPILRTPRGAPALPAHVAGSITHKRQLAMAMVAPRAGALQHVGIDLELRPTASAVSRPSIASRILTAREFATLEQFGGDALAAREHTLVHFALKEAVYKAIDPFVGRYVRFTEVELAFAADGSVDVTLLLPELADSAVRASASWHTDGEWIVATAFSVRAD